MHCPEFHLHSEDQLMPCSAEYFMRSSKLQARHPDGRVETLKDINVYDDGSMLVQYQEEYPQSDLWLELDPAKRSGIQQIDTVPIYANVKAIIEYRQQASSMCLQHKATLNSLEYTNTSSNSSSGNSQYEAIEINYITLFAYNGPYTVAGCITTGAHDGDIEHITARVDCTTGDILGMWYNSHRSRDGEWVSASQIPRSATGRPIAYVALHGHGNYPRCGTIPRHFFLGNDRCDNIGRVWRPRRLVLLPLDRHLGGLSFDRARLSGGSEMTGYERALMTCPSRGSLFVNSTKRCDHVGSEESAAPDGVGGGWPDAQKQTDRQKDACYESIDDDPCRWLCFKGNWGATQAMSQQRWFYTAETPVSRTAWQRLFFHFWPETDHIIS